MKINITLGVHSLKIAICCNFLGYKKPFLQNGVMFSHSVVNCLGKHLLTAEITRMLLRCHHMISPPCRYTQLIYFLKNLR